MLINRAVQFRPKVTDIYKSDYHSKCTFLKNETELGMGGDGPGRVPRRSTRGYVGNVPGMAKGSCPYIGIAPRECTAGRDRRHSGRESESLGMRCWK